MKTVPSEDGVGWGQESREVKQLVMRGDGSSVDTVVTELATEIWGAAESRFAMIAARDLSFLRRCVASVWPFFLARDRAYRRPHLKRALIEPSMKKGR